MFDLEIEAAAGAWGHAERPLFTPAPPLITWRYEKMDDRVGFGEIITWVTITIQTLGDSSQA